MRSALGLLLRAPTRPASLTHNNAAPARPWRHTTVAPGLPCPAPRRVSARSCRAGAAPGAAEKKRGPRRAGAGSHWTGLTWA